jgi:hypothetical protein
VILIDLPCDLSFEDNEGPNIALMSRALDPELVVPGAVFIAGGSAAYSYVQVDEVDGDTIEFHQITASEAAEIRGSLIDGDRSVGGRRWVNSCATPEGAEEHP